MSHRDNTELGKYKIEAQIGEGAMGVVYRAIDPVLNRTVAIKVMSDALARDDDLRGRFLREAQAAGSLQHPNVITIYDCGEVDGHLFIAMEFVEGEDLEDVLNTNTSLTLVDKIDIVIDVLGGLAYAHKRGIVHRDIKPANIRIDLEGRARIMDFGIAHLASSNMTRTGVMVGTPAYMAPEQIVGGAITPATDIFSVGAVLYELLSGLRPFHADTLQSVMYKIVSQPEQDLTKLSPSVPAAMSAIVHQALAKNPADRFASALDMANALSGARGVVDKSSLVSRTVSLRSVIDTALAEERAAKTRAVGQRGVLIGGSVAAGAIGIAAALFFWSRPASSPQSAPTTANPGTTSVAATLQSAPAPAPQPDRTPPAPTKQAPSQAPARPAETRAVVPPPTPGKSATVAVTPQELSLFQSLRNTALDARRRAVEAGASADILQSGDDHTKAADSAVVKGKLAEAANHMNQATAAWNAAERDARLAASAAAARIRAAAEQPKQQAPTPPPVAAPVVNPAPVPAAPPAANPAVEIKSAVAAYARAIESRDIAEVRRAYPSITAAQASGFEQFFGTVRSIRVTFSVDGLDVSGATAEAKLVGDYDYVTRAGKSERQPVTFQASFKRDGGSWTLASVR